MAAGDLHRGGLATGPVDCHQRTELLLLEGEHIRSDVWSRTPRRDHIGEASGRCQPHLILSKQEVAPLGWWLEAAAEVALQRARFEQHVFLVGIPAVHNCTHRCSAWRGPAGRAELAIGHWLLGTLRYYDCDAALRFALQLHFGLALYSIFTNILANQLAGSGWLSTVRSRHELRYGRHRSR